MGRYFPSLVLLALSIFSAPASVRDPSADDKPLNVPIPAGATHILMDENNAAFRRVFTYFPFPQYPRWVNIIPPNSSGVYRVEVTPEGKVVAVTILKTLGKRIDALIMKNFLTWKAKPGPLRVVDITWYYSVQVYGGAHM